MSESPDHQQAEPHGEPARPPRDVRRHLLFGLAMALAFGSMYAGILGGGRVLQYGLAGGALLVVLFALATGATKRQ